MEDANDLDGVEGEVHLARLTLEIYEVMVDYCRYMHASFSEMLKNTDEKDLDEDFVLPQIPEVVANMRKRKRRKRG